MVWMTRYGRCLPTCSRVKSHREIRHEQSGPELRARALAAGGIEDDGTQGAMCREAVTGVEEAEAIFRNAGYPIHETVRAGDLERVKAAVEASALSNSWGPPHLRRGFGFPVAPFVEIPPRQSRLHQPRAQAPIAVEQPHHHAPVLVRSNPLRSNRGLRDSPPSPRSAVALRPLPVRFRHHPRERLHGLERERLPRPFRRIDAP